MFIVCCSLCVVGCSLFVEGVCWLLVSVDCCLLFVVVCCFLFAVLLFVVC